MRIAFIASEIPDHAIAFCGMMTNFCDVLLCIPEKFRTSDRSPPDPRIDIDWLSWPRQRHFRNILFSRQISRRIKSWNPDIIHFLNEGSGWNWLTAAFLNDYPIITTVHDLSPHPGDLSSLRVPRFLTNALIRQSDAVVVHGETLRINAKGFLPISANRIFSTPLVPPLIPSTSVKHPKDADERFRILFYGRIYEYKGLRYLLEAMSNVRADVPNAHLIVAGRGDSLAQYTPYIADALSVEFRNRYVTLEESVQLYTEVDLVALPYIEASQSGPLMTAMAFGQPVVATDVGELSHVILSADVGLVVPPRDAKALATAIIRLARDDQLRKRFSENGKKAMKGEYSQQQIGHKVLDIYRQVLIFRA